FDGHDDHDRLAGILDEAGVPGLIGDRRNRRGAGVAVYLGLGREALEDVRGRTSVLAGGAMQPLEHDRPILRVDLDLAPRLVLQLPDRVTGGILRRTAE